MWNSICWPIEYTREMSAMHNYLTSVGYDNSLWHMLQVIRESGGYNYGISSFIQLWLSHLNLTQQLKFAHVL